jgi:hypothetical protein
MADKNCGVPAVDDDFYIGGNGFVSRELWFGA